ncbi:MAG TPA: FGGY-family carbohydrate kinase [Polyangiaceae bacterium]
MERCVLAWDLGTSGAKAGLVNARGEVLGSEFEPTELLLFPGGGAEQRPDEWWEAFARATERLLARNLAPRSAIVGVGVTAQWSATVAVDADGRALMNAILWMDSRGAEYVKSLTGGPLRVAGYGLHKLVRWVRLTGGAPVRSGKDAFSHMVYIQRALPDIYARTKAFLTPKDYLTARLTGRLVATFDSIADAWVTDNRDPSRIDYVPSLVALSGLDREKFPELCASSDVLGPLLPEHRRRFGLPDDVPVIAGAPDVHSAAIGAGTTRDFEPHLYIGTSSWIAGHVPKKKTDIVNNMASLPAAIPGRYLLLNDQETAGACLNHLRDKLFYAPDALANGGPPPNAFELFDRAAETSPPGANHLLFLPWLYGERTPVENPLLRAALFNYSLAHQRADVIRAVLEGVALNARWLFGHVERFFGRSVNELRLIGGGAESRLWSRIFADVLDRRVLRVEKPQLSNLRGAALIAWVGLGELGWDDVPERVRVYETIDPDSRNRAVYDERYAEFQELYRRTRGIFARMNRPRSTSS